MLTVCLAPDPSWSVEPVRTFCREIRERLADRVEFVDDPIRAELIVSVAGALPEKALDADVAHVFELPQGDGAESLWLRQVAHAVVTSFVVTCPSTWIRKALERDARIRPLVLPWGVREDVVCLNPSGRKYVIVDGEFAPTEVQALANRLLTKVAWLRESPLDVAIEGVQVIAFADASRWREYERWRKVLAAARLYICKERPFDPWAVDMKAAGAVVVAVGNGSGHTVDVADAAVSSLSEVDTAVIESRVPCPPTWEGVATLVYDTWVRAAEMKRSRTSRVAIVIPAHNPKPEWLSRSLGSALNQTYEDTVIVVVDDGSDPPIDVSVVEGADRVVLIRHDMTLGVAESRNDGIRAVESEYVCCLDHDDEIAPTFVETCVRRLEASSRRVGVVYTGVQFVWPNRTDHVSWPPETANIETQRVRNQIPTCNVFRRTAWERAGGYRQRYAPQGAGADDAALWLDMMSCGFAALRATSEPLFSWYGGIGTSSRPDYRESNWRAGHAWDSGRMPFVAAGARVPHVTQYCPPLVTVIVPVGPRHDRIVVDAIDSVRAQTFPHWDLIVVNDSDKSLNVPPFARVIDVDARHPGRARNAALDLVNTPYVLFLDADDMLLPECLAVLMERATENAWVYPDALLEDGRTVLRLPDWDVDTLYNRGVAAVTALYPLRLLREVGGFATEGGFEDWDLHMRLATAGYCGVHVPHPLFVYRQRTGTMRTDSQRASAALDVRRRFSLEEMRMACKPCAQQRKTTPPPVGWTSKADDPNFVAVEYTGTNVQDLIFRGPSGRAYVFGANDAHRRGFVHKQDVSHLLRTRLFRVIE